MNEIPIQMGFSSFLKHTFIIFAAHLATSCGASFDNHCRKGCCKKKKTGHEPQLAWPQEELIGGKPPAIKEL
jgi:hypothetical protein